MSFMADPLGAGRALTSTVDFHPDRLVPDPNPNPVPDPSPWPASGVTVSKANLVWARNGDGEIATATINNSQGKIVGQVAVDSSNNSVSVTQYDPSTGRPAIDAAGKPLSSTFHYDADGYLVSDGNLPSENLAATPLDPFTPRRNQLVTLQERDGNFPNPISVDIAPDLQNPLSHSLSAWVNDNGQVLYAKQGGLTDDGSVAPKQVSVWSEADDDKTQTTIDKTYVTPPNTSPTPTPNASPTPQANEGWFHDLFSGL